MTWRLRRRVACRRAIRMLTEGLVTEATRMGATIRILAIASIREAISIQETARTETVNPPTTGRTTGAPKTIRWDLPTPTDPPDRAGNLLLRSSYQSRPAA